MLNLLNLVLCNKNEFASIRLAICIVDCWYMTKTGVHMNTCLELYDTITYECVDSYQSDCL